jgi:hypothetical protein
MSRLFSLRKQARTSCRKLRQREATTVMTAMAKGARGRVCDSSKPINCHHLSTSSLFIRSEGVLMAEAMLVLRNVAWKRAFVSINMMRIAEVKS